MKNMPSPRPVLPGLLSLALILASGACRTDLPRPADHLEDASASHTSVDAGGGSDLGQALPDTGASIETGAVDGGGTEASPSEAMASACGQGRPDVGEIVGAHGLAIDRWGTIYFTRDAVTGAAEGHVGRMRPGAPVEASWLRAPLDARSRGLALDEARGRLYLLGAGSQAIYHVDVSQPGAPAGALATLASGLERPNDIAVGPDGHVYYTAEADRQVYRLSPAGVKTVVTTSPTHPQLPPSGLTFAPDGTLLVGIAGTGPILRLTLGQGIEQSRRNHGHLYTWGNALALDRRGRLYVVTHSPTRQGRVVMIVEDESTAIEVAAGAGFGSLAFGRGALDCKDLYIAVPSGPLLRLTTDGPGF